MIPRASYSAPLDRFLRRRRWVQRFEVLSVIALVAFLAALTVVAGHSLLTTFLNLTFPGTPPGCC